MLSRLERFHPLLELVHPDVIEREAHLAEGHDLFQSPHATRGASRVRGACLAEAPPDAKPAAWGALGAVGATGALHQAQHELRSSLGAPQKITPCLRDEIAITQTRS